MENCIFCKIAQGSIPSNQIGENVSAVAFLDAFPISKGHTLVIPKRHYAHFGDLPHSVLVSTVELVQTLTPRVIASVGANGYNLGLNNERAAGQMVEHVHWHIIPRFHNDGLKPWPNSDMTQEELAHIAEQIRSRSK